METNWFLAELIFHVHESRKDHFHKQLRLLSASSEKEAYLQALITASGELDKHNTPTNKEEQWEFAGIGILQAIENPEDMQESYLTIEEPLNAREFLHSLRIRNASLQNKLALTA